MAFTQSDLDSISLAQYEVYFDDLNLGYIVDGSLSVAVAGQYTQVDNVNQFEGTIKLWSRANIPTINFSVFANDVNYLRTKLMKGQVDDEATTSGNYRIGFGVRTRSSEDFSGVLLMTPYPGTSGDYSGDFRFTKAVIRIDFDNIIAGSKDTPAEVPVSVTCLPDTSQATGFEYGTFGDWYNTAAAPLGVSITSYQYVLSDDPRISLTALTLQKSEQQRLEAQIHYGSVSVTATTAINNPSNYGATDTDLIVDSVTGISAGDFFKINSEYVRVSSVNSGTNTLTVQRNALGSTAASINDDTEIFPVSNLSSLIGRDIVTWNSATTAEVTVGSTYGGTGANRPGVLVNVNEDASAGTSVITATYNSVPSPDLTVTAS